MITKLEIKNFKCFNQHEVPLRDVSIIVGRNNAGKSTLVEALRLVSLVTEKYAHLKYHEAPDWSDIPSSTRGVSPSLEGLKLNLEHAFYQYGRHPALIRATFSNRCVVEIYLGPDRQIFGVVKDRMGRPVISKSHAGDVRIPPVAILPQIGPLVKEETILQKSYVLYTGPQKLDHEN